MVRPISQNSYYYDYNTQNNPVLKADNTVSQPSGGDSLKLSSKEKFDYSVDDGKISFKDKLKNFAKGIVSPITTMFSSPKNFLIGAGMIAGGALLMVATGGAAAPALVALGVAGGAVQLGVGAYKAHNAKTDAEAEQAWQGIGAGTSAIAMSVAGSKAALKGAGVDTKGMGFLRATAECFKQAPKSVSNSVTAFKSGEALLNVKNVFKPKETIVNSDVETSPAKEVVDVEKSATPAEPQKVYKSSFIDENGQPLSKSQIQKRVMKLTNSLRDGEISVNDLTDEQILDIWSHRTYDRPLNDYPEIQQAFIDRFNAICESNKININQGESIIRTIPEFDGDLSGEFALGKPSTVKTGENWPAAAARVSGESDSVLSDGLIARIVDDKNSYLLCHNLDPNTANLPDSYVFVVDTPQGTQLTGFDWTSTGIVEMGDVRSGFGSSAFRREINSLGYSTEVNFSGSSKFIINSNVPEQVLTVDFNGRSLPVRLLHILPKS
ncbi:hypothetical protein II906_05660 [bacterium]|nr:hypothetical protein [bacterium]